MGINEASKAAVEEEAKRALSAAEIAAEKVAELVAKAVEPFFPLDFKGVAVGFGVEVAEAVVVPFLPGVVGAEEEGRDVAPPTPPLLTTARPSSTT